MVMEPAKHVDAVRRESVALVDAARAAGSDAVVPSCPEWTIDDLLAHVGRIQRWVNGIIATRPDPPTDHWRQHEPHAAGDRFDWFAEGADSLVTSLGGASPEEEVWTWSPDHTVRFWARRMAHEVAMHRWDAQRAAGDAEPVERELAVDGIQEMFDLVPVRLAAEAPRGSGETIHLHCTDGDGEWMVRFSENGLVVTNEHGKGDVAAKGTASDLLLLVWGRIPATAVEVFGDAALLDRWQEQTKF
jgi:uncharacterized protein (TIGR03083 family)